MPNPQFHVFLSHNSADKPAVEELARRLKADGMEPWLDKWHLIPGDRWQPAIEEVLAQCASCAVFIGADGIGTWQDEEMRAAINRRVTASRAADPKDRFRVIPVLLPGVARPERSLLPAFLVSTTWVEFRATLDEKEPFRRLVCGVRGVEPGDAPGQPVLEGECPYRGLECFDVAHARFFFGREALTEWLLTALRRTHAGQENRFLAVLGPSGSGKSSLARAGLIPALKAGGLDGSADWPVIVVRPGADPLESLAVALSAVGGDKPTAGVVQALMADLRANDNALHLTARLALRDAPATRRLVVLVDAFEEVFTLCADEAIRTAFIDNLMCAAAVAGGQTVVVLTMRADFLGKCTTHPALAAALSDHQTLVGPMTEDELRRSIERPARRVGCEVQAGLVDVLIQDVQGQSGALPLMQYALLEVWQRRDGRRLTLEAYRAIGGLRGAGAAGQRGTRPVLGGRTGTMPADLPAADAAGRGHGGHEAAGGVPGTGGRRGGGRGGPGRATPPGGRPAHHHRRGRTAAGGGYGRCGARGVDPGLAGAAEVDRRGPRRSADATAADGGGARMGRQRPRRELPVRRRPVGGGERVGGAPPGGTARAGGRIPVHERGGGGQAES